MKQAPQIECIATGVVYRNPKPYLRSLQAYHPSLIVLDDQEFLVSFDLGSAVEGLDYGTYISRSTDGGRNWQLQGPILDGPPFARTTTHSIRTSRISDGILVGFGGLHYRDNPEEGLVNRETLGAVPMDLILVRSDDRGKTWSAPEIIKPPLASPAWEVCHSIIQSPDGRWLAPTATWRGWNGENPAGEQALVLVSEDQGKTWPTFARTFDGRDSGLIHWEQSVVPLKGEGLLAVAWVHDPPAGKNLPTPYAISHDGGRSFSAPKPTGLRGQTCKVIQLKDSRILCVYRRDDQPGLWANLSQMDGDDWVNLSEQVLWQGAPSGMTGQASSADELASLRFGYPSLAQLANGAVWVVFWCVEDCVSNIRWFQLQATE